VDVNLKYLLKTVMISKIINVVYKELFENLI